MGRSADREYLRQWEDYRRNLIRSTPLPIESESEKAMRIKMLEDDIFKWFKYYFPAYCTHEFALFQKRSVRKVVDNNTIYHVDAWAREHAKTAISMMLKLYMMMAGKVSNILFVSRSFDNAVDLITPTVINLESNRRLISDYGSQKGAMTWDYSRGKWITTAGVSIRAIGMGQSPRGTRNEEKRPDWLEFDDADVDEVVRNETRLNKAWDWIEQAAIPSMSIDHNKRILFKGNIIAKDSVITRAIERADYHEVVNILDRDAEPTWRERFTLDDINWMLSKISYASGQKEYFNNPISEGSVFKEIYYKKPLPLTRYQYLVCYTDPSFKATRKNDFKATWLIGKYKDEFHVLKGFLEQTTTAEMVRWHYEIMDYIGDAACYYYMEANLIQDILMEEFKKEGEKYDKVVPLKGDTRKKPDKFTRIESLLEPLNRSGKLWFNEKEKNSPHMKRLEEQFKAIEPGLPAHDDGPDAVEGGVWIINNKERLSHPPKTIPRKANKKRY